MHIVIPNDWNNAFARGAAVDELRKRATVTITRMPGPEQDAALAAADVAVGIRERTWYTRQQLERMPNLKAIAQISGMEVPHIDLAAATERGVLVCHNQFAGPSRTQAPTQGPGGMVELTIGMMMTAMRGYAVQDRVIREGGWPDFTGRILMGKTLGIVGLGRIGVAVAKCAQYFGMEVIAAGRTLTPERAAAAGVGYATLDELFAQSDVISVHLKSTADTRGMIDASHFARMKPGALFVNTARGPVVVEDALVAALQSGRITAALDVYDEEPLPADHPLRACDNALLLGHCGWATEEAYEHMVPSIVRVVTAFLDGAPVNVINADALKAR